MKWISVKDRIPEPYVDVLLLNLWENEYNVGFCKPCYSLNVYWRNKKGDDVRGVTHWQPLPEPPKEVENVYL